MKHRAKVQFALDESRMLVLGAQVLLGFDLQVFLLPHYDALETAERVVMVATLVLLLAVLVLVLVPTAHHRIVDGGEDTPALDVVTRWALGLAPAPLALALAGAAFVVGARDAGRIVAAALAVGVLAGAAGAWYVLPLEQRRRSTIDSEVAMSEIGTKDKIAHVLTELRVVLPGTQALLGFQLAAAFQAGFETLPPSARLAHLLGFILLAASVVLLLLPAAYHRIAEDGEVSERLHRVSSVALVLAMFTLAWAIGCDVFLVVYRVTGAAGVAFVAAACWLVVSLTAWIFGMFAVRALRNTTQRPSSTFV